MQRKRYITPHSRGRSNIPLCRYYNSSQGCKYGTRCRFSHQKSSSQNNTWNGNNYPQLDPSVDIKSLRTLLTFFVSPKYKIHAPMENILSMINNNKSNQHFMEIICSDILQLRHFQLSLTEKSSHVINVLKLAIEIIIDLDAKYISQQTNWFNIAIYLCKTLNKYLSLQSVIAHLFAHLNDNLYCEDTISYLLKIIKEIMSLNPKLQIPLVFIKNIDFISQFSSGCSNQFLFKQFPSPRMLTSIFNACNFGQILPFDTNLMEIKKKLTTQQKIDNLWINAPRWWDDEEVEYYKLHPHSIPGHVVKSIEKSLGYDKPFYEEKTGYNCQQNTVTTKFRDTIHRTMPLHWIIISIRVFRDVYWNNIQNIIQNIINNDDENSSVDDIYCNNNTNVWNLDVMHVIVDYVGDNNALHELEKYKLFECDELNDIYTVVQCLKILSKNMDVNTRNGFYKANGKSITEWLNYFVKHRNYKCVPKTQNELMKCNFFFANRAISK